MAPTNTRIPFANSSGKFTDDADLTFDSTNKILTVDEIRLFELKSTASQAEKSVIIGSGAGVTANTTVSRRGNVAIGTGAMANLTGGVNFYDGAYSVAVGYNSMNAMTTGGYNTAVGYGSMQANQTGIQQSAFGYWALRYGTGGSNTAFGYYALKGQSGSSTFAENAAFGRTTLNSLTTGFRNGGFHGCLQALTTGNYNNVFGSEAYERLTTQSNNTGMGHWTGVYNRGNDNATFGAYSLGQTTTDSAGNTASYNSFFGSQSGRFHAVGNYNSWFGYDSGSGSTVTLAYTIAIGANAKVTEDYSFVLGSTTDAERSNYGFGGESYGSGRGVMFIKNAYTNPSTNPTGGGILYTEGGALKYRGSSGTVTTIANA